MVQLTSGLSPPLLTLSAPALQSLVGVPLPSLVGGGNFTTSTSLSAVSLGLVGPLSTPFWFSWVLELSNELPDELPSLPYRKHLALLWQGLGFCFPGFVGSHFSGLSDHHCSWLVQVWYLARLISTLSARTYQAWRVLGIPLDRQV